MLQDNVPYFFTGALSPLLGTFSCALGYDMASLYIGTGMEYSQASGRYLHRRHAKTTLSLCLLSYFHIIFLHAFAIVSVLVMSSDTFNRQR